MMMMVMKEYDDSRCGCCSVCDLSMQQLGSNLSRFKQEVADLEYEVQELRSGPSLSPEDTQKRITELQELFVDKFSFPHPHRASLFSPKPMGDVSAGTSVWARTLRRKTKRSTRSC